MPLLALLLHFRLLLECPPPQYGSLLLPALRQRLVLNRFRRLLQSPLCSYKHPPWFEVLPHYNTSQRQMEIFVFPFKQECFLKRLRSQKGAVPKVVKRLMGAPCKHDTVGCLGSFI